MSYLKLPKQLFKDPKYKNLSANAKLLYALLLDRHSLSEKNNKTDEKGKTVVYFTREEARSILGIGKDSIIKCFADLKQAELLEEGFLGVGKTHPLYIKNPTRQVGKSVPDRSENADSNKTELSKTDINNTELSKELKDYFLNYSLGYDDGDGPPF